MPTPQDEEFVRFAVAGGHLAPEQGDEALAALAEIERLGGAASAPDVLERRGLLEKRQIGLIHEAIASSRTSATVPKELGEFELLEKLGQGGTGTVFKARQKGLERFVAVKVLSPRLARDKGYAARFRREARAAARLTHPNIVAPIDVGESEGFCYFAMEYVDGESVAHMLARAGRLSEAQALAIAIEVAAALDHASAKGVVHRGIKPANILVTRDGRVRVADFGLAKAIGRDAPPGRDAKRFLGSPVYLAPEELRAAPDVDCRVDIYSLGITLFEMLTGDVPFHGPTPMAVAAAAVAEPVPSVRSVVPETRIATARVIERMVAKDRAARFDSPADLHAALKSAASAPRAAAKASARPRAARPQAKGAGAPRAEPRRRKSKAGSFVVGAIAIAMHVALFFWLFPKVMERWDRREAARGTGPAPVSVLAPSTSSAVPPPASSTPTPVADDPALLREIRKALDDAVAFAANRPTAYASRVARLRRAVGKFTGDKQRRLPREGYGVLLALRNELQRAERALADAAKAEVARRRAQADEHLEAGRVAEALRAFDGFPTDATAETTGADIARARREIRDRALGEFTARDAKAQALVQQDRFDHARDIYLAAKAWSVPAITQKANARLKQIDRLVAQRSAEAQKAARDAYPRLVRELVDRLAERDYETARKVVDTAIVDPKLAPIRDKLRPFQGLVRAAGEVWAQMGAALRKLQPGDTVHLGGIAAEFVRIEDDKVYVQAGSAVAARPFTDFSSRDAVALASSAFGTVTGPTERKLALFLLADRDYRGAREHFARAEKQGVDVAPDLDLMSRIAPRPCMTCHGEKIIDCPTCGGKGYTHAERVQCESCNGRGWFLCRKCRGQGWLHCANCGGTGRITGGFRCMSCYGTGRIDCPSCKKGRLTCKKCGADGVVTKYTVCDQCKGKKRLPCPKCGGKGFLPPLDLQPAKPAN